MIIEITRGVPVDITTALSASDTAKIGMQASLVGQHLKVTLFI